MSAADTEHSKGISEPTTSVSLGMLGMGLILVSIGAFFFSLAAAYYFALRDRDAPTVQATLSGWFWVSTGLIIFSSFTFQWARRALRLARFERYRAFLGFTFVAGLFFFLSQLLGCRDLARQGVYVTGNPKGSMYFVFSGVHAVHMLGGIGGLFWLLRRARELKDGEEQPLRRHRSAARITSYYWHFMGLLWIGLFTLLLVWGQS